MTVDRFGKASRKSVTILAVAALIAAISVQERISAAEFGRKTCKLWEVVEWEIENSDFPVSNPYDLVAEVTFTHEDGQTRKIEMFFRLFR